MGEHCQTILICGLLLLLSAVFAQQQPLAENFADLVAKQWKENPKQVPDTYWRWGQDLYDKGKKDEALRVWLSVLDVSLQDWDAYSKMAKHLYQKDYRTDACRVLASTTQFSITADNYFEGAELALQWQNNAIAEKFLLRIIQRHWEEEQRILPKACEMLGKVYEVYRQKCVADEQFAEAEKWAYRISQLQKGIRPMDVKIVMTWDTETDVDLWVTNPQLKRCFYSSKITTSGEKLHNDDTDGHGPETFTILKGQPGRYKIQANYFRGEGVTKAVLVITFNVGSEIEKQRKYTVTLNKEKDLADVIEIYIPRDLEDSE